jgi:iron-sulfur cluster assembly accessory protein
MLRFRLHVQAGGCEQFYYKMDFDSTLHDHDRICHCDGLEIVIDEYSLRHMAGLKIDYSEDLMGGGFRFQNPKAAKHCGCGNSFAVVNTMA